MKFLDDICDALKKAGCTLDADTVMRAVADAAGENITTLETAILRKPLMKNEEVDPLRMLAFKSVFSEIITKPGLCQITEAPTKEVINGVFHDRMQERYRIAILHIGANDKPVLRGKDPERTIQVLG